MSTAFELKASWQAAQAVADRAYSLHLSASRQSSFSWGGNSRLTGAAYAATQAWRAADLVADFAFATYINACDSAPCAAAV